MTTETTTPTTEPKAKRAPPRAAAPAPAVAAPIVGGMRVMATRAGTYPNVGETYGRYRKPGEAFVLNNNEDFAAPWMRELADDEVAEMDPAPAPIPQTTGRHKPQATFAPLQ